MSSTAISIPSGHEVAAHVQNGFVLLLDGSATVMGAPLRRNVKYYFEDRGVPIVAHGPSPARVEVSRLAVTKPVCVASSEIAELHARINVARHDAAADETRQRSGPRVLIVGDVDTGKSSLCRTLLNLAFQGANVGDVGVAFVDVDVGQNAISIPGVVGATFHEGPVSVDDDFTNVVPLAFFFGDKTVTPESKGRYLDMCGYINECIRSMVPAKDGFRIGGLIINTMGWVSGLGYALLQQLIEVFGVTDIIVSGSNLELARSLRADTSAAGLHVTFHNYRRPAALYERSRSIRSVARSRQLLSYFIGTRRTPFAPCRIAAELKHLVFLCAKTLEPVQLGDLKPLCVVAVSHAPHLEAARSANVAGFLVILDVGKTTVTFLAPSPEPLPRNILLVSTEIVMQPDDVPPIA